MPATKTETSELDRLRAEYEAEQRAAGRPAPPPAAAQPAAPAGKAAARKTAAPKPRGRPRTAARVAAVQALYQSEQTGEPAEVVISQFQRHRLGTQPGEGGFEEGRVPEADVPLFSAIVLQVARNSGEIDGTLSSHLDKDWPLVKLDPVLRALLRAACGELTGKEPPAKVVINEYLDIAHGFFGGDEPRFANGVLDAMARTLRAEEFAGGPPRRRGG